MSKFLAVVVFFVLVFGGAVGCGMKAYLGVEQSKFLTKKFTEKLNEMEKQKK